MPPKARNQKYAIKDNFIRFWFRFVNKHMSIIENQRFDYVKRIVQRDLPTFAGPALEKLFQEITGYSPKYGMIGTSWERGNLNEIDLVAVDDLDREVLLGEVKLNPDNIRMGKLREKSENLRRKYKGYSFSFRGLSLEDICTYMDEMEGKGI